MTAAASALTFNIEGVSYVLTPSSLAVTSTTTSVPHTSYLCVAGHPLQLTDLNCFESFMATTADYNTSVNWDDPLSAVAPDASTTGTGGGAFVLDSGATCHISPTCFDFKASKPSPRNPLLD
jgi:hypothetical protein